MTRVLDIEATAERLRGAGVYPETVFNPDPNVRRLLEALCIRHNIPAVYKETVP